MHKAEVPKWYTGILVPVCWVTIAVFHMASVTFAFVCVHMCVSMSHIAGEGPGHTSNAHTFTPVRNGIAIASYGLIVLPQEDLPVLTPVVQRWPSAGSLDRHDCARGSQ